MEQIKYSTTLTMSRKWNIPEKEIINLCEEGKIEGATFNNDFKMWVIPSNAVAPYIVAKPTPSPEVIQFRAPSLKTTKTKNDYKRKAIRTIELDGVAIAMIIMLIAIFLFLIGSLGTIGEYDLPSIYKAIFGYKIGDFVSPPNAGLILVFAFTIVSLIVTIAVLIINVLELSERPNVLYAINAVVLMFCFIGFVFSIQSALSGITIIGFCPVMVIILYFVLAVLAVYKISSKK